MNQHISKLNEEFLLTSKKNEIRQKSKMRNKEFRSAAQRLTMAVSESETGLQKTMYPPQSKRRCRTVLSRRTYESEERINNPAGDEATSAGEAQRTGFQGSQGGN